MLDIIIHRHFTEPLEDVEKNRNKYIENKVNGEKSEAIINFRKNINPYKR